MRSETVALKQEARDYLGGLGKHPNVKKLHFFSPIKKNIQKKYFSACMLYLFMTETQILLIVN